MQREQQNHFRKIRKQHLVINQLIHQSEPIQSEQGKKNKQISEQYTSIDQIRGLAVMHDEVLGYFSKTILRLLKSPVANIDHLNTRNGKLFQVHNE